MSIVQVNNRWGARAGTAADLAAVNEVPLLQEPIFETDTGRMKLGDGTTHYNDLPYFAGPLGDLSDVDAPSPSDGQVLTWEAASGKYKPKPPASGGGGAWAVVKKIADESRSATTLLADDAELHFPCVAGATYVVRLSAIFSIANATMDFKYSPAFSAAFTENYTVRRAIFPGVVGSDNEFIAVNNTIINSTQPIAGTASGMGAVKTECCFTATASGTFSLQWAQNTSDAGVVKVLAGSYLEYMEI